MADEIESTQRQADEALRVLQLALIWTLLYLALTAGLFIQGRMRWALLLAFLSGMQVSRTAGLYVSWRLARHNVRIASVRGLMTP